MKSKLNVMRKWLALIIFAACLNATNVFGDNIFSENMGAPSATTAITSWTGWQNNGILTFTGTADVRITTPSSGYIGASGVGNIYIANTVGKDFEISGINTLAYSNISLSAGIYKSTTASNGSELLIEVSSDGVTYVPMTFSLPSGTGTATWHLTTPTGAIPACANLRIRFTQTGTGPQFRIDDVVLNGTIPTPPGNALNLDGTNDFINCGNGINIAGQSFTVEFWTKREANNEDYIITQGIGNLDQGLHIGFRNATVLTFAFWADDIDVNIPYDNFWHHYAFSYDANTNLQTVYRDGNIVGTRTAFGDYVGIGTFYIGNSFGGGSEYGGSLDEVRIWNGVRSQTQIQDEMTNIISPASSGLLAYYRFDQNKIGRAHV